MRKKKKKSNYILKIIISIVVTLLAFFMTSYHFKAILIDIFQVESKITESSAFPSKIDNINVHTDIIELGKSRPGIKRKIKYIVIHETDNYNSSANAKSHAKYLQENNDEIKSWHYTVDEHEIYHHIPDNEIAYHAGDQNGNLYGVGIELCVNNGSDFNATMDNAARLAAFLLKEYDLSINDVKMHKDFSGKDCPHNIIKSGQFQSFKKMIKGYL